MNRMESTDLVPRKTIAELVGHRDRAISGARDLRAQAERANEWAKKLNPDEPYHAPTIHLEMIGHGSRQFDEEAHRRMVDRTAWLYVIRLAKIDALMGVKQRDDFYRSLDTEPPAFTEDNVRATLVDLAGRQDEIFRQSIVDVFERLPRRYRTHNRVDFGRKIIFAYALDTTWSMSWSHRANGPRDLIDDLDRAFHMIAGETQEARVSAHCDKAMRSKRIKAVTRFMEVRFFRNGNIHVVFRDQEAVRMLNRVLADHYGAALGDLDL